MISDSRLAYFLDHHVYMIRCIATYINLTYVVI